MHTIRILLALTASILGSSVWAEEAAGPPIMLRRLADLCAPNVQLMISKPELAPVLQARPVDVASVCRCTQEHVFADRRLVEHFSVDEATQQERIRVKSTVSYGTARLLQGIFACIAPEMDASLGSAPLEK